MLLEQPVPWEGTEEAKKTPKRFFLCRSRADTQPPAENVTFGGFLFFIIVIFHLFELHISPELGKSERSSPRGAVSVAGLPLRREADGAVGTWGRVFGKFFLGKGTSLGPVRPPRGCGSSRQLVSEGGEGGDPPAACAGGIDSI